MKSQQTNIHKKSHKKHSESLVSQVAVVSAERQFDSHYLEEHLDLDLKELTQAQGYNAQHDYLQRRDQRLREGQVAGAVT